MMPSRIISLPDHEPVTTMAWAPLGFAGSSAAPGNSKADLAELTALRQRVQQLERELQQRVAEAREAGRADGEAQGRAAASASLQPVIERSAVAVRELTEVGTKLRRDAAADLVELAVAIARRILHRECSIDVCTLEGLVQAALDRLDREEVHRVLVHPAQAAAVRKAIAAASNRAIEVVEVHNAEPGSLVFETNRGRLDASIETQLREIQRGLADRVNR